VRSPRGKLGNRDDIHPGAPAAGKESRYGRGHVRRPSRRQSTDLFARGPGSRHRAFTHDGIPLAGIRWRRCAATTVPLTRTRSGGSGIRGSKQCADNPQTLRGGRLEATTSRRDRRTWGLPDRAKALLTRTVRIAQRGWSSCPGRACGLLDDVADFQNGFH